MIRKKYVIYIYMSSVDGNGNGSGEPSLWWRER